MNKIDELIRKRTDMRRDVASKAASLILADAEVCGIDICLVGSLAAGQFRVHSDVDLLVQGAVDGARRAMVERLVADRLRGTGLAYDIIFAADLSAARVEEFLA